MLGRNLDDTEAWVRTWGSPPSEGAEATAALAGRIAGLTGSAASADGAVQVGVGGTGNITDLRLRDGELAATIIHTVRRAQAALVAQVAEAVRETVGEDSQAGKAVLESFAHRFPDPPDEPAAPVMPAPPPFPTFQNRPSLPHQPPGNGFESGRDSRAR